jgi:hypothetical protein
MPSGIASVFCNGVELPPPDAAWPAGRKLPGRLLRGGVA